MAWSLKNSGCSRAMMRSSPEQREPPAFLAAASGAGLVGHNSCVPGCCSPDGYSWVFSERRASSEARRFRRKGLDGTSRRVLRMVTRRPIHGTVLEVGGGIGGIQVELLKAGAVAATNVELIPTYETAARELLREAGLEDRVQRRVADFASAADGIEPADMVVMNRVVCCYPDMPRLVTAAANRTRDRLVISYPAS